MTLLGTLSTAGQSLSAQMSAAGAANYPLPTFLHCTACAKFHLRMDTFPEWLGSYTGPHRGCVHQIIKVLQLFQEYLHFPYNKHYSVLICCQQCNFNLSTCYGEMPPHNIDSCNANTATGSWDMIRESGKLFFVGKYSLKYGSVPYLSEPAGNSGSIVL